MLYFNLLISYLFYKKTREREGENLGYCRMRRPAHLNVLWTLTEYVLQLILPK